LILVTPASGFSAVTGVYRGRQIGWQNNLGQNDEARRHLPEGRKRNGDWRARGRTEMAVKPWQLEVIETVKFQVSQLVVGLDCLGAYTTIRNHELPRETTLVQRHKNQVPIITEWRINKKPQLPSIYRLQRPG
jgi:hypothetical protein